MRHPSSRETQQEEIQFPRHWLKKVEQFLAKGRKRAALKYLDQVIENDLPLFGDDPKVLEERHLAVRLRVQLLREWEWYSEALAWLCLECAVNSEDLQAQALRDRLMRHYRLRHEHPKGDRTSTDDLSNSWPGVAGMHDLKAVLERDVIMPLQNPDLYKQYKLELPNGVLLYGPPGCGKTFIARKLAERVGFTFREVKPSALASIYVHGTQQLIKSVFDEARKSPPFMLFLDELDAMVPNRGKESVGFHYSSEVNEFLTQLDECWKNGVFVVAATNLPENIDPAVRRPGRLDKKVYVGPPDIEARKELFRLYLEGRPQQEIDLMACAGMTESYTCAEVKLLVEEAARAALQDRRDIELADIMQAIAANKPQHSDKDIERYRLALDK